MKKGRARAPVLTAGKVPALLLPASGARYQTLQAF